jgi:hypothetical protein
MAVATSPTLMTTASAADIPPAHSHDLDSRRDADGGSNDTATTRVRDKNPGGFI